VSEGGLLDALAAQIQLRAREGDDVERVHDGDRVRQGFGGGILVAAEPVHRHDRDLVAESLVAGLEPAPHRRGGASRDQVEQPRRPGPVDDSGEVGDHGDEAVGLGAAGVGPLVFVDADHPYPDQARRTGLQQQPRGGLDGDAVHGVPGAAELARHG
jgi:hypothetical protein